MKQRLRFEKRICVTREYPEDWLIIGTPDAPSQLAADDGQLVALYELVEVFSYHKHPTLELLGHTTPRRKRAALAKAEHG